MSNTAAVSGPVSEIEAKRSIDGDDVRQLRRLVLATPGIDPIHAEMLLRFEKRCHTKVPVWQEFYVDTLTDYFVWQTTPPKRVGVKAAKQLFEYIVKDGKVAGLAELELLINIAHWSAFCQELVVYLVLKSVHDSVLTPKEAIFGQDREQGVITAADVHLIRRALYIGPLASGYSVTRRQADLLFDLNDGSKAAENHEDWSDLFVKAIGSHMIYPEGVGKGFVPEDFKSRDEWAEESRAVGLLLMDFGRNDLRSTVADRLREIDVFGRDAARREKYKEDQRFSDMLTLEYIEEDAARWLLDRITGAESMNPCTLAVLRRLRHGAGHLHPYLAEVLEKLDL